MKNSRVAILSSVSTTYVIRPIEDILCIEVEVDNFGGELNDDVMRELSIHVVDVRWCHKENL